MRARSAALVLLLGAAAGPAQAGALDTLAWLAGCWSNPRAEAGSGEYWLAPAGGTMLGLGRTVRKGKTVEYEFLRLHEDAQGRAVYTATPARQQEAAFVATQLDGASATFENPAHDFPQKIVYTRIGADRMAVRIEGAAQGGPRAVEFQFTRAACPG